METSEHVKQKQSSQITLVGRSENDDGQLNFDTRSYQFHDLDLAMAVGQLARRDQTILILRLMGHTQVDIGVVFSLSRSMISKRLTAIRATWRQRLGNAYCHNEYGSGR